MSDCQAGFVPGCHYWFAMFVMLAVLNVLYRLWKR
jgi:hypothetical protein